MEEISWRFSRNLKLDFHLNILMAYFSIIIPTFNRCELLNQAIEAVLNQTFIDYELIIIDDGSTDNTKSVISKYTRINKIKYFYQNNKGVSAARNKGVDLSEGKFIVFLDSDDFVTTNWLKDFHTAFTKNDIDVCLCGIHDITRKKKYTKVVHFLAGAFCLRKKILIESGGYDENLKYGENTELSWRVLALTNRYLIIDRCNVIYRRFGTNGIHYLRNRLDAFNTLKLKHSVFFSKNKKIKQKYYQVAAVDNYRLSNFKEAKKLMTEGYLDYPFNGKAFLRMIMIHFHPVAKFIWKNS